MPRAPRATSRRPRWWCSSPPRSRPIPIARFAFAPSAPKLIPAIVIGIASSIGRRAKRVPMVTAVSHFSR